MEVKKYKILHDFNENTIALALEKAGLYDEARKVNECGTFGGVVQCANCKAEYFKSFDRCKSKFCSLCNKTKSLIWIARLFNFFKNWLAEGKYIVFLNFTIRDRESLSEALRILQDSWRIMQNSTASREYFNKVFVGGLKSLEVKLGKNSNIWHPHLHCIVLKEHFTKDTDFLHAVWPEAILRAGGSNTEGNLKIVPFNRYDTVQQIGYEAYEQKLLRSVIEAVKYITKFDYENSDPNTLREVAEALKGKRQISTWGVLYDMQKQADEDMKKIDSKDISGFVCKQCGSTIGTYLIRSFNYIYDNVIYNYSTKAPKEIKYVPRAKPVEIPIAEPIRQMSMFEVNNGN